MTSRFILSPMSITKLDPDALHRYLDAGHTQADAARHFGVSESAISQRMRTLQIATSKVIALERAGEVVDQKLDATARLQHVQDVIDEELRCAVASAKAPGADRARLQDTILKLAAEVRQQLGLQLNISRTLIDLKVVREFQQSVVEVISEESPEVARRVVARLKERRALREYPTGPRRPRRCVMWRDPMDELIADLETVAPPERSPFCGNSEDLVECQKWSARVIRRFEEPRIPTRSTWTTRRPSGRLATRAAP